MARRAEIVRLSAGMSKERWAALLPMAVCKGAGRRVLPVCLRQQPSLLVESSSRCTYGPPSPGPDSVTVSALHHTQHGPLPAATTTTACVPRRAYQVCSLLYQHCRPVQDVTYEVALFFAKARTRAWSDVIVTLDGHEVFAESREEFAPGPGNVPEYHSKRFEARAGALRPVSPTTIQ